MKSNFLVLTAMIFVAFYFAACSSSQYKKEIDTWRAAHEADLKKEDGWLTVAGLFWLKEGLNTIGKGDAYDIALTDNFKGNEFGEVEFKDGKAILKVKPGVDATTDGKPVTTIELASDDPGPATMVKSGSETLYLIKREDRYGVRLKDSDAAGRVNFPGEHWFPIDERYRVIGTFEAFETPQEVEIPNVLGGIFKMKSPGIVKFKLDGKELSLQPVIENDKQLFFIFKDLSGHDRTYPAGRFLYTDNPVDGKVILDFNKAENPPCAFTEFATCPLPPPQNRLDVDIRAGELKTH